jgi:putative membrane protein
VLWFKSFHVVFVVAWFAGLFYLPRLFVYAAMNEDPATAATFRIMQRRLLIMTHIGGALTWLFGLALILYAPHLLEYHWLQIKLVLVLALSGYHYWCVRLVRDFANDANRHSHRWYRWFNEVPTVILIVVVVLAVVKPF